MDRVSVFAVYDLERARYVEIFDYSADLDAAARFSECCRNQQRAFGLAPQRFNLHAIGGFQPVTGELWSYASRSRFITNGRDVLDRDARGIGLLPEKEMVRLEE